MPGINGACDVPHAAWLRSSLVALCSAVAACVIGDQPSYMCIMSGRRWGGCGTDMSVDREHTDELRDERHVMRESSEMRSCEKTPFTANVYTRVHGRTRTPPDAMNLSEESFPPPPPKLPLIPMPEGVLELCPVYGPLLGFMGAMSALVFSNLGAAYGTGKAGQALSATGVTRPDLTFKNIIPIVMAGVLGIFGLIIAVVIGTGIQPFSKGSGTYSDYSLYTACAHLCSGLTVGLASLACGICIGISGDAGIRSVAEAPKHKPAHVTKVYVGMVLIQGCASALAMYGLIIALLMSINVSTDCNPQ